MNLKGVDMLATATRSKSGGHELNHTPPPPTDRHVSACNMLYSMTTNYIHHPWLSAYRVGRGGGGCEEARSRNATDCVFYDRFLFVLPGDLYPPNEKFLPLFAGKRVLGP